VPEGDTIHRAAQTLSKAIAKKRVLRGYVAQEQLTGPTVDEVFAVGKHLFVRFDDGRTLHTHMRMDGSWHIYRAGEKWQRPMSHACVVLETDVWHAVCFDAPVAELVSAREAELIASRLGPDLLADDFSLEKAMENLRSRGELPVGVAIMQQSLVAGIGNVYKSECLFLARVDPFALVSALDDPTLRSVLEIARRLMRQNMTGYPRITRRRFGSPKVWVYDRSGRPCFECAHTIRMRRQGEAARSTYYCPNCQRAR
jgi:endonuclease VIII